MDWMEMLKQIFQVCIIPLLGILTVYIVKFINAKSEELKATANNELYQKYITLLTDTITSCVIATNQTYVDALKDKNAFDKEAQKEAFNRTYNAILAILTDDVKNYFTEAVGDF
jgi:PKD repeat protein